MPRLGLLLVAIATFLAWETQAQQQGCGSSADFIFVLDSSGSLVDQPLRTNNWAFIQEFLQTATLNIGETVNRDYPGAASGLRFALVQFRDVGVITFGLTDFDDYREAARIMGLALNLGGQTNMAAGLEEAEKMLTPRRDGNIRKSIIIAVSDWSPFNDTVRRNTINTARRLERDYGAEIVTVGVLGSVDQQFLSQVASPDTSPTASQNVFGRGRKNVMSEDHQRLLTHISPLINVACETPNMVPTTPARGGTCERDIVFAVDASYSLSGPQDFAKLKTFVSQVAGNIFQTARDTRMGVVTFSTSANVTMPLQLYSQNFATQINAIQYRNPQYTNHADALRKARELLQGSTRSKFVIIFTDGRTTVEQGVEQTIAQEMRDEGIQIIAFGVSNKIDFATLEKLVGRDKIGSNVFWSPDYQTNMISKLNTLTQVAEGCPAREIPCDVRPPEVVIALDASGSIKDKGANNWQLMQNFGVAVAESIAVTYPNGRVGALVFSDNGRELTPLTDARDIRTVTDAIRSAKHVNGFTNEADAMRVAGRIFQGARNPSYKYIIMVTDGQPTLEQGVEIMEADRLESEGIFRIMIGVTNDIKRERLKRLGSSPSDRYVLFTEDFSTLNAVSLVSNVVTAAGQCQRPQPNPPPPARQCFGADVIFAMDSSGSIEEKGRGNFELLKRFTSNLAGAIAQRYPQTRFGLVLFSDRGILASSLNRYRSLREFADVVARQNYSGTQTNIAAAISVARQDAETYGRNNPQIILITDGEPTADSDKTIQEADRTRQRNIQISAVGITYDVNSQTLVRITGSSNRVHMTPQFADLQNVSQVVQVIQVACQEGGSRAIPDTRCTGDVEVVFSLDASGSIEQLSPTAWQDALNLVKSAINAFYRNNPNTRFGLVIFSDRGRREFGLTGDISRLPAMVDAVRYDRGRTNIADGIEIARTQIFRAARSGSRKILILITDGEPNERVQETTQQAELARREGINIVSVGITETGPDYNLLLEISGSQDRVIRSLSFSNLNSRIDTLVQTSCNPGTIFSTRANPNAFPGFPQPTTPPRSNFPGFFQTTPNSRLPGLFPTPRLGTPPAPRFGTPAVPRFGTPAVPPFGTPAVPRFGTPVTPRFPTGVTQGVNFAGADPTRRVAFAIPPSTTTCDGGHIILVLDVTNRLHYKTLPNGGIQGLGQMAANIVNVLNRRLRNVKFAVVTYEGNATLMTDFGAYRDTRELEDTLRNLAPVQTYVSNMADAFLKANQAILRARAPNPMVILISDGETTIDKGIELTRADNLRSAGAKVVVIAVSKNYEVSMLDAISRNDPEYFTAETYRFDATLLEPFYRSCRSPNVVASLRDNERTCADEIVFVVDSSNNMNGNDWDKVRSFLISAVDEFSKQTPSVKFGSVLYGNSSQLGFYISSDYSDIKLRLRTFLHMGGSTNMASGLRAARQWVFKDNKANKMLILLVNGEPTIDIDATYEEADTIKNIDIDIVAVGITSAPSKYTLERLATSSENVVRVADFNSLKDNLSKIVRFGCKGEDNVVEQAEEPRP